MLFCHLEVSYLISVNLVSPSTNYITIYHITWTVIMDAFQLRVLLGKKLVSNCSMYIKRIRPRHELLGFEDSQSWNSSWSLNVQVSLTQARIDMSELDEDSDGFLQPHVCLLYFWSFDFDWCSLLITNSDVLTSLFSVKQEMENYIGGLIPNLAQLRDMPDGFVQMYCRIAAHKFFFFCDPHKRGWL